MAEFNNAVYLSLFGVMLAILAFKTRHLASRWGNPRLLAVCSVVLVFGACAWVAAPVNLVRLSSFIGVPNSGTIVLSTLLIVVSASYMAVALLWRYPAQLAWRRLRWIFSVYALLIVAMCVSFAVSDTPEERPTDWGYYYIEQLSVVMVTILWILPQLAGALSLAIWCFAWSKDKAYKELPWLRRGLRFYGGFGLCMTIFSLGLLIPVIASLFDVRDLNAFGVFVPPVVTPIAALCLLTALVIPVWGPRLAAGAAWVGRWRAFLLLRPLHAALIPIKPDAVIVTEGKRFNPHHRVRRMLIELNDWRLTLTPHFDGEVGEWAEKVGRQDGLDGDELTAAVEATQLIVASQVWRRIARPEDDHIVERRVDHVREGDVQEELTWWVQISRAYKKSSVVGVARTRDPWPHGRPVRSS